MTDQPPAPRRRATAQQVALDHIRNLIARGFLKPDDRIRQEQLAANLGSSVIPVREALKILEVEGQIRYEPHRGYHVTRLSLEELLETYEIRRLLENEVVRIATPALDEQVFATLERTLTVMGEASDTADVATMIEANREFHFAIFAAAGRPRMVDFIRMLWQTTDAYRSRYYGDPAARQRVDGEHRRIVEALRARDVEGAIDELERHRTHAVEALAERLTE